MQHTMTMMTNNPKEPGAMHPAVLWLRDVYLPSVGGNKSRAAMELGMSHKVLNSLLAGTYAGDTDRQLAKLDEQRVRLSAAAPAMEIDREFVPTEMMRRIWAAFDTAKSAHLVNKVVGPPQIGKTTAAKAYKMRYPETTVLLRLLKKPTMTTVARMLTRDLKLEDRWRGTFEARCRIMDKLSPRHLVIVDEAHLALEDDKGADALDMLRDFSDVSGCAIALMVTDFEHGRKLTDCRWKGMFSQLFRRGFWEILPDVPSGRDIAAIWQAYGLPDPDAETARVVGSVVKKWCFGEFARALRLAYCTAVGGGRPLVWDDFNAVLTRLGRRPQ